jgi:hypothetical protein
MFLRPDSRASADTIQDSLASNSGYSVTYDQEYCQDNGMELQASWKATNIQELIVAFFRDSSEPDSNQDQVQAHRTGLQASEGDGNMKNYKSVASNENELFYLSTLPREPRITRSNLFITPFPREQPNANLKLIVVSIPVRLPPKRTPVSEGEQVGDHLFAQTKIIASLPREPRFALSEFTALPRELSILRLKLIVDLFFERRTGCFKAPIFCPAKCSALCEGDTVPTSYAEETNPARAFPPIIWHEMTCSIRHKLIVVLFFDRPQQWN